MPKDIKFEGKTYRVPDDATPEEIDGIISGSASKPSTPAAGYGDAKGTYTKEMSPAQIAGNQFLSVLEGLGVDPQHPILGTIKNFIHGGGETLERVKEAPVSGTLGIIKDVAMAPVNALGNILSSETSDEEKARGAGQFLASTPIAAAEVGAVTKGIPPMLRKIPSTARAGENFGTVAKVANPLPINAAAADDVALRAQELASRGSTLPKVIRDYMKQRGNSPTMTYEEGRDFAKNAGRLSATERMAANPEMKMLTGKFYNALKTANRDVAESVGMGKLYDSAIKEFRQASTLNEGLEIAAKWAGKSALAAAGAGILYKAYEAMK